MFDHSGIWLGDTAEKDSYRDFLCKFTLAAVGKLLLRSLRTVNLSVFLTERSAGSGNARIFRRAGSIIRLTYRRRR